MKKVPFEHSIEGRNQGYVWEAQNSNPWPGVVSRIDAMLHNPTECWAGRIAYHLEELEKQGVIKL